MATVRDLIKGSLRLIGAIAAGETPTAAEQADALSALNDMIDSWSNDGFLIFEENREEFDLTVGKQVYRIGPGGDFDTKRPQVIQSVGVKQVGDHAEIPIRVFNQQEWARVLLKNTESTLPQGVYYNASYPQGEISVWPVPSAAAKVVLYSLKPLSRFSSVDDELTLPPGYARMLRYNLAVEIAPEYGQALDAVVATIAVSSKADIKRANTRPTLLRSDVDGFTRKTTFNYLTGE